MSSLATSSPVSSSTFEYLIRWPVFRFSWLKEIFSDSEVAGYSATGQVTRERRRKPFQFARGAMDAVLQTSGRLGLKTIGGPWFRHPPARLRRENLGVRPSADSTLLFMICSIRRMT